MQTGVLPSGYTLKVNPKPNPKPGYNLPRTLNPKPYRKDYLEAPSKLERAQAGSRFKALGFKGRPSGLKV